MTDNETIKALECCSKDNVKDCAYCPYDKIETKTFCANELIKDTLDLINRQNEKIEELRKRFTADADYFANEYDSYIRAEAIKEFWNELKRRSTLDHRIVSTITGDNLVEEMTEDCLCRNMLGKIEEILELKSKGYTIRYIAHKVGYCERHIYRILKQRKDEGK